SKTISSSFYFILFIRNRINNIPVIIDNMFTIYFIMLLSNKSYLSKTEKPRIDIIKTNTTNTINIKAIFSTFFIFNMR
ncbi:MAG TPA: hypothetical protein PLB33_09260, partial [Sedimentibacter sp.]|nr:hypothetical protein [Sedimentibacter sp.]